MKSSQSKINQKMKDSIANLNGYNSSSTTKKGRKESVYLLSKSKSNISSISSIKSIDDRESRKMKKYDQSGNIDMDAIIKI